jgi:hypothetical protein
MAKMPLNAPIRNAMASKGAGRMAYLTKSTGAIAAAYLCLVASAAVAQPEWRASDARNGDSILSYGEESDTQIAFRCARGRRDVTVFVSDIGDRVPRNRSIRWFLRTTEYNTDGQARTMANEDAATTSITANIPVRVIEPFLGRSTGDISYRAQNGPTFKVPLAGIEGPLKAFLRGCPKP